MRARPLTRNVSLTPGRRKRRPMPGLSMMLRRLSVRLLPSRSGTRMVLSSRMATKPGASPRGEQSPRPSAPQVAMTKKGERAIKLRQCSSSFVSSFCSDRGLGARRYRGVAARALAQRALLAAHDDRALARHHALLHPALGTLDVADAVPMVELCDDLDRHVLAGEDPIDRILLAGS